MTRLAQDSNGHTIQAIRPGTVQTVAVSGVSAAIANSVGTDTTIIRIVSTTNCHYRLGNDPANPPAAVVTDSYLAAGVVEFVSVGKGDKIAFIQDTAGGTAYVTEGA